MGAVKAVQAAHELRLEAIDGPPDVDQVRAQGMGRDPVDRLVDERIDRRHAHGLSPPVSRTPPYTIL